MKKAIAIIILGLLWCNTGFALSESTKNNIINTIENNAMVSKAKFGHSKDRRSDCRQVLVALIVTPEGFSINYEVLAGNTAESTTLMELIAKIETMYGKLNFDNI